MCRRLVALLLLLAAACERQQPDRPPISEEDVATELEALNLEPGRWETSTAIVSVTGPLPAAVVERLVGRRTGATSCITPAQAARPSATFLAAQQGSECTYQDFNVEHGRLTASMRCSGGQLPAAMDARMAGAYSPRSYDLAMDMMTSALPGAEITIRTRSTGRRLGDCT